MAIKKVVLSLVNINPSLGFQKALCGVFAVKLRYYRMKKKLFSVFPKVMGEEDVKIYRESRDGCCYGM